jgi:hypothetical protein
MALFHFSQNLFQFNFVHFTHATPNLSAIFDYYVGRNFFNFKYRSDIVAFFSINFLPTDNSSSRSSALLYLQSDSNSAAR